MCHYLISVQTSRTDTRGLYSDQRSFLTTPSHTALPSLVMSPVRGPAPPPPTQTPSAGLSLNTSATTTYGSVAHQRLQDENDQLRSQVAALQKLQDTGMYATDKKMT